MAISFVNPPVSLGSGKPTVPPILLHHWQQIMLESPWHFGQIVGTDAPLNEACPVYVQPRRDMIARSLYNAYSRIQEKLTYSLQPTWHVDRIRIGHGVPVALQSLRTDWKQVQAIGMRATSLIDADAAVVYSKSNAQLTADDTATITVPTSVTNVEEIQVFFRVADGAPGAADARWQIAPLTVTLSGGNAIITGHRSLFVQPSIWKTPWIGVNQTTRNEAVTTVAADFVTLVDVYRVYPDATNAVTLITDPVLSWCCNNANYTADVTQAGVAWLEDARLGIYRLRLDANVCQRYGVEYVELHYLAGCPLSYQDMDSELATALVHLTNTLMPQVPCEICNQANASYQEDINVQIKRASKGGGYVQDDPSPFGVAVGAHRAWQIVDSRRIVRAGKLTR